MLNNLNLPRTFKDFIVALVAIMAGAAVIHFINGFLGVRIEHWYGVATFNVEYILALIFVPFIAGMLVTAVYGLGGKILAHFSPLIILGMNYIQSYNAPFLPNGADLFPPEYMVLPIILAMEFCALGGFAAESMIKKIYGRNPQPKVNN